MDIAVIIIGRAHIDLFLPDVSHQPFIETVCDAGYFLGSVVCGYQLVLSYLLLGRFKSITLDWCSVVHSRKHLGYSPFLAHS